MTDPMPPAPFDVEYAPSQNLLRYTMRGFWSLETVTALATALRRAIEPLGPPPLHLDAICDASDFPVQSRDVSEALGQIMDAARLFRTGRTAIVVGSFINKLQAERTLGGADLRTFLHRAGAEAWLRDAA